MLSQAEIDALLNATGVTSERPQDKTKKNFITGEYVPAVKMFKYCNKCEQSGEIRKGRYSCCGWKVKT